MEVVQAGADNARKSPPHSFQTDVLPTQVVELKVGSLVSRRDAGVEGDAEGATRSAHSTLTTEGGQNQKGPDGDFPNSAPGSEGERCHAWSR